MDITGDEKLRILAGLFELRIARVEDDREAAQIAALVVKLGGNPAAMFFEPRALEGPDDEGWLDHWPVQFLDIARHSVLWFVFVAAAGLLTLLAFRGWGESFESSEGFVYLLGLSFAVAGEIAIELIDLGRALIGSTYEVPTPKAWRAIKVGAAHFFKNTNGAVVGFLGGAAAVPLTTLLLLFGINVSGQLDSSLAEWSWIVAGLFWLSGARFICRSQG